MKSKTGRRFAITDIHGCLKTFQTLVQRIELTTDDTLFLLGDYIDRGPDSKGVIDYIWQLQSEGFDVQCLQGNHEYMAVEGHGTYQSESYVRDRGEYHMLASFGIKNLGGLPKAYVEWMDNLPYYFETEGYLLVHAGLNFRATNPLEDENSLIWIRDWYADINREWLGDRIVLHGHTPTKLPIVKERHARLAEHQVLNLDAGCVFEVVGMGYLCAFNLETQELIIQSRIDT